MMEAEFFRHLRPHWFNKARAQLEPLENGGVTFLLSPVAEKTYDYWVYICPDTAPFSAKAAVKRLREVKDSGTTPWGTITLNGQPIMELLAESAINPKLPSSLSMLIRKINALNELAEVHKSAIIALHQAARNAYNETRKDR